MGTLAETNFIHSFGLAPTSLQVGDIYAHCFIITNPAFFVKHEEEIRSWLEENDYAYEITGMIIWMVDDAAATAFKLTWG